MADQQIVEIIRRYLRAVAARGIPVRFGVLYGSWARGEADTWSDIDLLVVSPRFDLPRRREDIALLWRVTAQTDSRIEPVPCGVHQWAHDEASPLYEIARREGSRVDIEPVPAGG